METILMNTKNSKTNEPHKFACNLLQRFDLRSSNKHVAVHNRSMELFTTKILPKPLWSNPYCELIPPVLTGVIFSPRGDI